MEEIKQGISTSAKVILICTILLVVFLSSSMYIMFKYVTELTNSPLIYGANKIAKINHATDVSCSCLVSGTSSRTNPEFYFNTTDLWNDPKIADFTIFTKE